MISTRARKASELEAFEIQRETEREGEKGRKERGKREREAAAEKFTLQGVMARKEARASERGW